MQGDKKSRESRSARLTRSTIPATHEALL